MKSPLRQAREKRGLTLKEIADAVSMDPGNLSRIERGEQVPSKDLVDGLVKFFGGTVTELQIIYPERYKDGEALAASRRSPRERRKFADRRAAERKAAAALKATS